METFVHVPDITHENGLWAVGGTEFGEQVPLKWSDDEVYSIRKTKSSGKQLQHQSTLDESFQASIAAGKQYPGAVLLGQFNAEQTANFNGIFSESSEDYTMAMKLKGNSAKEKLLLKLFIESAVDMVSFGGVIAYDKCGILEEIANLAFSSKPSKGTSHDHVSCLVL